MEKSKEEDYVPLFAGDKWGLHFAFLSPKASNHRVRYLAALFKKFGGFRTASGDCVDKNVHIHMYKLPGRPCTSPCVPHRIYVALY